MEKQIYLDYNATTPVHVRVLEEMLPWFTDQFWNAASSHHLGAKARNAVETGREQVAELIGCQKTEIIFTSGSTESINLAIKGAAEASLNRTGFITSAAEHKAVLDVAAWLEEQGKKVTLLPVDSHGEIDTNLFLSNLSSDTALVSLMAANNETGVITQLETFIEETKKVNSLFHTDATQAVGRLPFNVETLGVDLASLSGHKIYGPKGVGALYIRRGTPIKSMLHGGGHERGLRSGTLNVPGIVGLGAAAQLCGELREKRNKKTKELVDRLVKGLRQELLDIQVLAEETARLPNTVNIRFVGADADAVIANTPTIAVSSGSACTSMIPAPSHVLLAMGLTQNEAEECLRFSIGDHTTKKEIDITIKGLVSAVKRIIEVSNK